MTKHTSYHVQNSTCFGSKVSLYKHKIFIGTKYKSGVVHPRPCH